MAAKIEPTYIDIFNGEKVARYDLPVGDEKSVLMLDTQKSGYTAEWDISWGVQTFLGFNEEYSPLERPGLASFEPEDQKGFSKPYDELRQVQHQQEYSECTYLVIELSDYKIAWEQWEDQPNKYLLNVPENDMNPLIDHFSDSAEEDSLISPAERTQALDQAQKILEEKSPEE